jgi:curved DNA-binding protein CbpA
MTYYEILGIPLDADGETIRSAFRSLARRYHPDAGEGSSVQRFREVAEAYETLIDPGHRRLYDLSLRSVRHNVVPIVPVEPMVAASDPFARGTQARTKIFFHHTRPGWDDLFDEILHSIDDLFGPPIYRW